MKVYPKMTTTQKLEWLKCKAEGLIEQTNLMDQQFDQEKRLIIYEQVRLVQHEISMIDTETPTSWFNSVLIAIQSIDDNVKWLFDQEINDMIDLATHIKYQLPRFD